MATRSAAGSRTGAPIVDTPASISVVGRRQIEATGARSLPDALSYTPGLFANPFGFTPSTDSFLIRGFNAQSAVLSVDGAEVAAGRPAVARPRVAGLPGRAGPRRRGAERLRQVDAAAQILADRSGLALSTGGAAAVLGAPPPPAGPAKRATVPVHFRRP